MVRLQGAGHTDRTTVAGELSAHGGAEGGDGGFIETSAAKQLDIRSTPNAHAPKGKAGEWLIDPYNLTIVAGGSQAQTDGSFTATGDNATIGADLITAALNAGTSVTVSTGGAGGGTEAGDLTVSAAINALTPTTGGAPTLSLNAYRNIYVRAPIVAANSGGGLNVALNANLGNR